MKKIIALSAFSMLFFSSMHVYAAENVNTVEYGSDPVVDSDLDGLTDAGEVQRFYTNPNAIDSDGDTVIDGVEVQFHSDPNDALSIPATAKTAEEFIVPTAQKETPWAWYVTRASALIGFLLLYISVLFGLTIRMPFVQRVFPAGSAMRVHCWISLQALLFALVHGVALMFDKFMQFRFVEVFVPFASQYEKNFVALGTISFYIMLLLVITSYGRRFMSQKIWRILHFTNIILYVGSVIHAFAIGTDLKNQNVRYVFIFANVFLLLVLIEHIVSRIITAVKIRRARMNMQSSAEKEDASLN